jgi:hypothetical protein
MTAPHCQAYGSAVLQLRATVLGFEVTYHGLLSKACSTVRNFTSA